MESWLPLLDIFMNSPCPEAEASLWLQSSFNPPSNPSISISLSTASFLSLLTQSTEADVIASPSSSSTSSLPSKQRFMWIQTLPTAVQARILSFLTYDHAKFNKQDLLKLARDILFNGTVLDFWVKKAAHQLFDIVSDSNSKWISSFNLDSEEDKSETNFGSVPDWLKDIANTNDPILPWLPISVDELSTTTPHVISEEDEHSAMEVDEGKDVNFESKRSTFENDPIDHETEETALSLKTRIVNMESSLKAGEITNDIQKLCVEIKGNQNSLTILDLIQPWNVDDEVIPILLSRLLDGNDKDFEWTSNILCSIVLPKLLTLEKPASRLLITATIEYCKVHHKAAVYALLFPLILHKNGINNPICDVITKIVKECLHPTHVSSFCQKLLCEKEDGKRRICPPSYEHLVGEELVWSEPLFTVFQNVLNHNVHLSQDSVDQLVLKIQEFAVVFEKSLKFANFLLCFVTKCGNFLKIYKGVLYEAVSHTSTFLTKSILSKLDSI